MSEEINKQITDSLLSKSLVLGSKETLKAIKSGKAKTIIISSNCPSNLRGEIMDYASLEKYSSHIKRNECGSRRDLS